MDHAAEDPHLAHQLLGDGDLGDVGLLARLHQLPVALDVALVAPDRLRLDGVGDRAPLGQPLGLAVEVGEAGEPLHDGLAHGGVARLGYPAVAPGLLAAVVAPRGEAEVGGDAAAVCEAREVVHRGDVGEGGDAVYALEPGQRVDVGLEPGGLGQPQALGLDLLAALDAREDVLEVDLQRPVGRGLAQLEGGRPGDVVPGPGPLEVAGRGALVPDVAVPEQHRGELHLQPLHRQHEVVVRAHQVAGGLRLLRGDVDGPALAALGRDRAEERLGVAAVVLALLVGRGARDGRDGDHVASLPQGQEVSGELEAAGAGLVHEAPGLCGPRGPVEDLLGRGTAGQPPRPGLACGEVQRAEGHRPGVLVDGDHGCMI